MPERDWLVCHDYGMGGLWAVIRARTQEAVARRFRDLTIYDSRPKFIDNRLYEQIRAETCFSISEPVSGWLCEFDRAPEDALPAMNTPPADRRLYFVWGGVFADPGFRDLEPGPEECHGPFHDEAEANRVWSAATRRNIDIAQHRLFVLTVPRPGG